MQKKTNNNKYQLTTSFVCVLQQLCIVFFHFVDKIINQKLHLPHTDFVIYFITNCEIILEWKTLPFSMTVICCFSRQNISHLLSLAFRFVLQPEKVQRHCFICCCFFLFSCGSCFANKIATRNLNEVNCSHGSHNTKTELKKLYYKCKREKKNI